MPNPVTVSYADSEGLHEVTVDLDALPADLDPQVASILAASGLTVAPVVPVPDVQPADAPADAITQE